MVQKNNIAYMRKSSTREVSRLIQAAVIPIAVFFLSMASISLFRNFGRLLMAPAIALMWVYGSFCAIYLPSHQRAVIKETLAFIFSYNAALLALREGVAITSGISSEMLAATFNEPVLISAGNVLPGYLQNVLYIMSLMIPITYAGMQTRRLIQFRRGVSRKRAVERARSDGQDRIGKGR